MNIEYISTEKLIKDRLESIQDIKVCQDAIKNGIFTYSGGFVQDRLNSNRKFIEKIESELTKRNITFES